MTRRLLILIPLVSLMTACVGATDSAPPTTDLPAGTQTITVDGATALTLAPADLQFGDGVSTPVISKAQKFIIPIPALKGGGEPLVYPPGNNRAGEPIVDYKGEPIGDRGLVFFNQADQTVQAVPGDGRGVIIINEVAADQADALHQHILSLNPDPSTLTLDQLKQAITFAQEDLDLGDMYNSDRAFIEANMSAIDTWAVAHSDSSSDPRYGLKKRDDRDISQAVYVPGNFQFQGPAATPQVFEDGGILVQQGDSVRGVQPDVFIRTYSFSDGQPITNAADLATQNPF